MKTHRGFALVLVFATFAAQAIDPIRFRDDAEEARFQALAKELRCLVCQNESLADSSAGLAQDPVSYTHLDVYKRQTSA